MGYVIVCVIIGLIAVLLFSDVGVNIVYRNELKVKLCVFGLKVYTLYPPKPKKAAKARSPKSKQSQKAKCKKESDKPKTEEKTKVPLNETVDMIADVVKETAKPFFSKLRVKLSRIVITIATDDVAKTAVLYGAVIQACAYLIEVLKRYTDYELARRTELRVEPDFLGTKTRAEIDITLSNNLFNLLGVGLRAAMVYFKHK